MPHKFNAARRHTFDKAQYRVINWAEYNESLRQRGDLTIWVSDEAQSVWSAPRRTSRGGQRSSNASPDATAWERANSISAPIHATTLCEGSRRRWYVLDAKYRTTRSNVLDAMSSAHIYRDSLRWHQRKPGSAVLLVPRSGGAPWMEEPDFIHAHQVGVCALSPDTDIGELLDKLMVGDF